MKKNIITLVLFTFILILQIFFLADTARTEECLSYEPMKVKLTGTMVEKVFPGPPEFESVEKGDEVQLALVLKLKKPVCVKGDLVDETNAETEKNVRNIHLVIHGGKYEHYKRYVKELVIAEGTLFHAHTGHHRTKVLMEVISIKRVKDESKK